MPENLTQSGALVAPRVEPIRATTWPATYACTSVTTATGLRRHTLTTKNKALYIAFYEQVLTVDDAADVAATRGTFAIQFYADDAECLAVIGAAQGGHA